MDDKIDHRQYARKGYSTTDALLYMLQAVYEAVDSGEASARLFFADFTKGFHFIDHTTDARAGQTRDPSCPPEMDRGLPDQPVASSQNQSNSVRLANSERRSTPRGKTRCNRFHSYDE